MKLIILLSLFFFKEPETQEQYVKLYTPVAFYCQIIYGVPVSVQMAQAIQESGGGKSNIAKNSNNHFGIKYYKRAFKGKYYTDRIGVKWRAYDSVIEGYIDHAKFLNKHYYKVCYKDYKAWQNMKGYGERGYWQHITKIIEKRNYQKYDYVFRPN